MRPPPPSADDDEAWWRYVRHVAPLPGRPATVGAPAGPIAVRSPSSACRMAPAVLPPPLPGPRGWLVIDVKPEGMDAGTWERLRSGRTPARLRLDLHLHSADAALAAVLGVLEEARRRRVRCVEIVTGLGGGAGGVIRRELPHWLNRADCLPALLAAAHPARGRAGRNQGAVRLLLRREKL